jgi:hypothetical protein
MPFLQSFAKYNYVCELPLWDSSARQSALGFPQLDWPFRLLLMRVLQTLKCSDMAVVLPTRKRRVEGCESAVTVEHLATRCDIRDEHVTRQVR